MPSFRLGIALLSVIPVPLAAQCQLCAPGSHPAAEAVAAKPLEIEIDAALDFSRVAVAGGAGTVSIDPITGARRVVGGLRDLGGGELRGAVHVKGEPMRPIRVTLPTQIMLTAADGSNVEVKNIRTNLAQNPHLGPDGMLNFEFGGQLNVGAGSAGNYHGRVPISVEYQ